MLHKITAYVRRLTHRDGMFRKVLRAAERLVLWSAAVLAVVGIAALTTYIGRPSEQSSVQQSSYTGADQQPKRLVIFLDGTWNTVENNTNVWRMRALCASRGADGKPQLVYYGIGVNGFLGGVFGQGLDANIRNAYEWLVENYNDGDEIYIFGFSRGAYTARSLTGLVATDGILKAGSPIGVKELFDRYKAKDRSIWKLQEAQAAGVPTQFSAQEAMLLKYSQAVNVKMVGVWDTVGSIGWKGGNFRGISRASFGYLQTGLFIHIQNAYQALAIDEHREDFAPTLWDKRIPHDKNAVIAQPRPISSVEQRWFVGAHANVGGGYPTDFLAQAPLRWMMKKAEAQGLTFRSEVDLDGDPITAPIADSYADFAGGSYKYLSAPYYRVIGRSPLDAADGQHVNVNETIDQSVFDRWRADPTYRPANLLEWAHRMHVDPTRVRSTVRADDPRVAVAD